MHAVEVIYADNLVENYVREAIRLVVKMHTTVPPGDRLSFRTGEDEIKESCSKIQNIASAFSGDFGAVTAISLCSNPEPEHQNRGFEEALRFLGAGNLN